MRTQFCYLLFKKCRFGTKIFHFSLFLYLFITFENRDCQSGSFVAPLVSSLIDHWEYFYEKRKKKNIIEGPFKNPLQWKLWFLCFFLVKFFSWWRTISIFASHNIFIYCASFNRFSLSNYTQIHKRVLKIHNKK